METIIINDDIINLVHGTTWYKKIVKTNNWLACIFCKGQGYSFICFLLSLLFGWGERDGYQTHMQERYSMQGMCWLHGQDLEAEDPRAFGQHRVPDWWIDRQCSDGGGACVRHVLPRGRGLCVVRGDGSHGESWCSQQHPRHPWAGGQPFPWSAGQACSCYEVVWWGEDPNAGQRGRWWLNPKTGCLVQVRFFANS